MLLGEYAVLRGAPAIVTATAERARVQLVPATDGCWTIACPGFDAAQHRFEDLNDPRLAQALPLLSAVLQETGGIPSGGQLTLDTRAFVRDGHKLGLGSSAALAAALLWALKARQADHFPAALAAHRRFQNGRGSGIDVAASVDGGTLIFEAGKAEPTRTPVPWPLSGLWVWSGRPASTTDRLQRLEHFGREHPQQLDEHMAVLRRCCENATAAVKTGAVAALTDALENFRGQLEGLDNDAGLAVWTPAHRRIQQEAEQFGVFYKTSGAGGGDCGIALHQERDRLAALKTHLAAQGYLTDWLSGNEPGVRFD